MNGLDTRTKEFMALFQGRLDAYGTDEGSCKRLGPLEGPELQSKWEWLFGKHLAGYEPIGVYPLSFSGSQWLTSWGCLDIDNGDLGAAQNFKSLLKAAGVPSFIEVSRSKGYHVWVFLDEPIPAWIMRRALLSAAKMVQAPDKEINPKAEKGSTPSFLGNHVRLPYSGHRFKEPRRQVMLDEGLEPLSLEDFLEQVQVCEVEPLGELASSWAPPQKTVAPADWHDTNVDEAVRKLSRLGQKVLREGPLGDDRSRALAYLTHCCKDSGLDRSQALKVVTLADSRWGKFSARDDGRQRLEELVRWGYDK